MRDVFKKFKLEDNTIDFLGHAVALYNDDNYLDRPAADSLKKIQLYVDSLGKYGDSLHLRCTSEKNVMQLVSSFPA
jgi:Rab GDP dissociation inhibitor